MKSFLIGSLIIGLSLTGCSKREESTPAAPPPPPAPAHETKALVPPPTSLPAPTVKAPTAALTPAVPLPPDIVQKYQSLWNSPDEREKLIDEVALHAMDDGSKQEVVNAFAGMLRAETSPELKASILSELGAVEDKAALAPLLEAINPAQPEEVRQAAADAADALLGVLSFEQDKSLFDAVVPILDARYPSTLRETAINALQDIEDKRAIPHLQRLLTDPDAPIRNAAQAAIEWLQEE